MKQLSTHQPQQQLQHQLQKNQQNIKINSSNNNGNSNTTSKNQNNQSNNCQNIPSNFLLQERVSTTVNGNGVYGAGTNNIIINNNGVVISQQNDNKSQKNSFSQDGTNNNKNNHHHHHQVSSYSNVDYQDQANISSQLYSQQTPMMIQNPSIKQIDNKNHNNLQKKVQNANLVNSHQHHNSLLYYQQQNNIEILMSQNAKQGNQGDAQAQLQIIQQKKPNQSLKQQQQQQIQPNQVKISSNQQSQATNASTINHHAQSTHKGNSAQKVSKKAVVTTASQGNTIGGPGTGTGGNHTHHQRTKSDTYYNRGSITIKQSIAAGTQNNNNHNKEQSQSKRVAVNSGLGGTKNKNVQSIIEAHEVANSRQIAQPGKVKNTAATAGGHFLLQNSHDTKSVPLSSIRKVPNSANHSKKVSQSSNLSQAQGKSTDGSSSQPKKTTKEKYMELKAMYDDLLEKHYAQQQQFQLQQLQLAQNNNNNNNSNTNNKFTQQINNFILSSGQQLFNNPLPIQQIAHQSSTFDHSYQPSSLNSGINSLQNNSNNEQELNTRQPKTILKFQVPPQGQSRKNAQGNHKRSVSDGNEQLFKFKQNINSNVINQPQQMQRYLFPQPSNSNIQGTNQTKQTLTLSSDREEILTLNNRAKPMTNQQSQHQIPLATTPYQQPTHHRRVSDDYKQKQMKIQQNKQFINTSIANQQQYQQDEIGFDSITEAKKTNTIDFNIKEFLLEMRNKHNQLVNSQAPNTSEFINIVDEQLYSYNPPSPNTSNNPNFFDNQINFQNGSQFAMIIEENSPSNNSNIQKLHLNNPVVVSVTSKSQNNNILQEITRKASFLVDSSGQKPSKQVTTKNKPSSNSNDFTQIVQNYKQKQQFDQKRTSSPNLELDTTPFGFQQKNQLFKTKHKRVKSDVNEGASKNVNQNQNSFNNNPVNIQSSIIQSNGISSFNQNNQMKKQMNNKIANNSNKSQIGGSSVNLQINSDKNTPKKQIINQKQFLKQNTGLFNQQQLSSQLESSNSKKVINVSIDLIKDGMSAGIIGNSAEASFVEDDSQEIINSEYRAGNHWAVVENGVTEYQKDLQKPQKQQQVITKDSQQSFLFAKKFIAFSGPGPENDTQLRHNKYKKMINKYDNIIDNNSAGYVSSKKYTSEVSPNEKNSIRSSYSPSVIGSNQSPANRVSLNDKMNEVYNKQLSNKILMPLSPKSSLLQKKQKIKINNLMQQPLKKSFQEKQLLFGNAKQPKLQNAPPNNSAVNTQETPKASPQNIQQIQLTIQAQMNVGERIETQESAASDQNLSPRQKGINKLIKHIKLSFKQTTQPPNTTVDFYRIGKVLGKGAFGKVNLALHKLSGKFAAVKSINKQYLSEESSTKKVMQEVVILKRTRHRNIVRLYEFFETQKHILFVMELCAGGDLLNYVRRRRRLKEDVAKSIFKQIIEGLDYCHSKSILHRDIKLDNILLDSEGEVKICDFGVSKIVKPGEIMNEQCGTPAYIAPEILRDKGYQGFAVDIWSAGVVLYAMLYGTVPFKANNMSELQKLIIKAKYTLKEDGVSEDARSLLTGLLERDPLKRLTIEQILNHKWLKDVNEKIQLFTEQEKEYIKNEFTYNDAERYNRNETDPFTEHMLDSTNNSMLKNQTSKSVILAPFNSTRSNFGPEIPALSESMKALLQSKRCIKFAARVRDIDKQYEINNNAELDNGVYHKIEDEEVKNEDKPEGSNKKKNKHKANQPHDNGDDSLQSSFNKESSMKSDDDEETLRIEQQKQVKKNGKEKQTELEKLESLIYQQEDDLDNPYQGNDKEQIFKENIDHSQVKIEINESPRTYPHSQRDKNSQQLLQKSFIIEEKVVTLVEQMGYPRDYINKCIQNNDLNYATSAYYLLQNKHSLSFV